MEVLLVLFGLFIAFQTLRKIFGGSWSTENVIISFLAFNTGALFTVAILITQLKSDYKHFKEDNKTFKESFKQLATDFKEHIKKP